MNILVIGAGVLGSLYAARLHQAGHNVTILARGERLGQIRQHGIILEEHETEKRTIAKVPAFAEIPMDAQYDLVLVLVRKEQVEALLPMLARHPGSPNILFMVNNAAGPEALVRALGRQRVLLGFPGAGGERLREVVHYLETSSQPTSIGELDGTVTHRLNAAKRALESAGFQVSIRENMDAWLKTHVALVSPLANAIYLAGGDNYRLARTQDGLVLLIRGVKEGLHVLKALDIPITPAGMQALLYIPEPVLLALLKKRMPSRQVELVVTRHANHARSEMLQLANEFRVLVKQSGLATPALDRLYHHAQPGQPPAPEGAAYIPVNWKPLISAGLAAIGILTGLVWLQSRKRK